MLSLTLVVTVGLVVVLSVSAAARTGVAPPILLLLGGVLLGFVPALREVEIPPEAVLLLFLPVLLYWESFTSSLREIRGNLRLIVLLSTVLVAGTAAAVAVAAHAAGLPWGPAWVLGAALAPTDATAVGVLGRGLQRRLASTLRSESLVNDGTALVIYALAVGVTTGEDHLSLGHIGGLFALAYLGGAPIGLVVTWLGLQLRKRLDDPFQHNVLALVTPLTAYLIAEYVDASGVLAVVVSGLTVSRVAPRAFPAHVRQYVGTVMGFITDLANAALFVMIGLQAQSAVRGLTTVDVPHALITVALVSVAVIGARFVWLFTTPYLIRALDRRPRQRLLRMGPKARTVMAMAGFRGAVSLAAALAVPQTLSNGSPFPGRDLIIFATAGVIGVTLLLQAPLLPRVVKWADLGVDQAAGQERRTARIAAAEEALTALPELARELGSEEELVAQLRAEYDHRLQPLRGEHDGQMMDAGQDRERKDADLRLALLAREHHTVVRLRDRAEIDDAVLQQIEADLDLERIQLHRRRSAAD